MKLDVIKQTPTSLTAHVDGATATLLHVIIRETQQQKGVVTAVFAQEHPLAAKPKIFIETQKGTAPKDAVLAAIDIVKKQYADIEKQFTKAFA